jgi:hypothetical protein
MIYLKYNIDRVRSGNPTDLTKNVHENSSAIRGLSPPKTTIPGKKCFLALWWSEILF